MRGMRFVAAVLVLALAGNAWAEDIHLLAVATNTQGKINGFDHYANTVRSAWTKHQPKGGKFTAKSLLGKEATKSNVLGAIHTLQKQSTPKSLSVIYIDAHGGGSKKGLRIATVGKPLLTSDDLHGELGKFKGKVLLILDTCHAASFFNKTINSPNVAVITACGAKQLAYGKLPYTVAEAVSGKADYNKDGKVTLAEVAKYVQASHKTPKVQPVMKIPPQMAQTVVAKK